MRIAYSYVDVPTIARFSHSDSFIRGLQGPFGSGKSSGCVVEFPYRAKRQVPGPDGIRRTRWAVIRNTYGQLRDTTIPTFHRWLPPEYFGRWHATDHSYTVTGFPGTEFEVLFRALDKPQHVRNLLSLDLTGAWVNEAREVPWVLIEALQGRLGRYPPEDWGGATWSGMWMDTNPPDVDSKWYSFFEDRDFLKDFAEMARSGGLPKGITRPEQFAEIFHQPSGLSAEAENLGNLPGGIAYYQRMKIGKRPEWVKVYVDGEYGFVSDNKTVFPEYHDEIHLKAVDPVPGVTIERTWDWGLTPACIFSQMLPDGRWLIFDEMVATGMGADRFSDEVLEHCAKAFHGQADFDDLGDPAGATRVQTDERTNFEIVQTKGIMIRGGEQGVALRLEAMRYPLRRLGDTGQPRFILHPRCSNTRKALMGAYYYRKLNMHGTGAERYTKDPEKNHPYSDLMDCAEYRAVEHFGSLLTLGAPQDDYPRPQHRDTRGRSKTTGY